MVSFKSPSGLHGHFSEDTTVVARMTVSFASNVDNQGFEVSREKIVLLFVGKSRPQQYKVSDVLQWLSKNEADRNKYKTYPQMGVFR